MPAEPSGPLRQLVGPWPLAMSCFALFATVCVFVSVRPVQIRTGVVPHAHELSLSAVL